MIEYTIFIILVDYFFTIYIKSKATVDQLEQFYLLSPSKVKDAYLFFLLKDYREKNPKSSVIVFTNTCRFENIFLNKNKKCLV